ncbi:uncharacterized protein LOC62_02G002081 [Vanrija pseudolonga]|uniref:Uncharacterized protein n=1 Tax=Vanrija pseudolonga TaxID=143232 RepID=A0AAF0Y5P4_9TREE|nr:hypothetical protein LOC62_02G002081 [Vanrija pseudolonga]
MPRSARPSLVDELIPIPQPSAHGDIDSLAVAVRRFGSVAIITFFLVATAYWVCEGSAPPHRHRFRDLQRMFVARLESRYDLNIAE